MFAKVTLLAPPFSELTYTLPVYFPQDFWQTGMRVAVPMGVKKNSLRTGYISALQKHSELPAHIKYKNIFFPLETGPALNPELVELARVLGQRQAYEPGTVFGHLLPASLRTNRLKICWRPDRNQPDVTLSQLMGESPDRVKEIVENLLSGNAYFANPIADEAERELCSLNVDPPWPVRPAARRQIEILDYLHANGSQSRRKLLKTFGSASQPIIRKLIEAGHISIELDKDEPVEEPISGQKVSELVLNADQKKACAALFKHLDSASPACILLHGVTGSGKTAVYLELIRHTLSLGKSAFLLAPEVALAHKLYLDVTRGLSGISTYFYHGYQSGRMREKTWRTLASNADPCVIVGSRSALFLPVHEPGCIILDEEHDSSFKQDESFAYHAREAAWFRMRYNSGLLLLGSATPDLSIFHASKCETLPHIELANRVNGKSMPPIRLVDIAPGAGMSTAGTINSKSSGILAEECESELLSCLEKGEQAIILLNRRAYAPLIFCVDCNHTLRCPNCEIGLAYHKNLGKLLCHYCGYSAPYPTPCPDCGKMNFLPVGEGTEKLEERLELLARQPILRLDRDNVRRAGKMESILEDFSSQKSPFLVGTQMLSKGHHFPNVTLVIVADGDIGLNLPDYKAAERTFQLLVQAAGRAGRGSRPGKVLVQTRNRKHYCWEYIQNYDYKGFAEAELARRRKLIYPPFTHLAMLRINYPVTAPELASDMEILCRDLRGQAKAAGLVMLGPAPAPIAMLRGQKRYQCLFKGKEWSLMRDMYFYAQKHPASKKLRLFLDLDPVNMM